ncbi:MAG: glycosyltransferase family 4 protein [Ignavibacteriales bacterium]|nr:glycosyltransferase family 4 protein [Ignavibacteriales bacterium]
MKVTISCGGKFHAFHLAEQLDKRGHLHKLITPYYSQKRRWLPGLRIDKEKIDPTKVMTNILPALISRGLGKVLGLNQPASWNYYSAQFFDSWARNQIDRCDLLVAWSGFALHTIKAAKPYGTVTIVERGSSHILFQKEILEEEYSKYGLKTKAVDDRIVDKELSEYSEADYISVPSEFVRQTFIKYGVTPEKLIRVPYGVDLSHFKPVPKEDCIFRVIFVGGLTFRKGVHYLLEAFSQLSLKDSELLLIGSVSPEMKPFLKKYKGCYRYLGAVPHLELYKYYSQGSVFVLPSIEEGLAMVIAQAMACGLPVICSTNTGGQDLIRDGQDGFILPIRDVKGLNEKLSYLYKNPDNCSAMGKSSQERVSKGYSWDDYGDKIITRYAEVVGK